MHRVYACLAIANLLIIDPSACRLDAEEFDVVYLGGQSNMEGFGSVDELTEEQKSVVPGCYIFHSAASLDQQPLGGQGTWTPLKPGHGTDFTFDGTTIRYSKRFGVELSLATELRRQRPDRKLAIIKYARNGSSIHQQAAANWGCWEPDFRVNGGEHRNINQYDHFLATVRNAFANADVDHDGTLDKLNPIGIVWMQGESDAVHTAEIAEQYEANLKRLMDLVRAAFRDDDLPVVIGQISDSGKNEQGKIWTHGEIIRHAQASFVAPDESARLIKTTDTYGYSDPFHYDSAGYLDLGKQFATGLIEMLK